MVSVLPHSQQTKAWPNFRKDLFLVSSFQKALSWRIMLRRTTASGPLLRAPLRLCFLLLGIVIAGPVLSATVFDSQLRVCIWRWRAFCVQLLRGCLFVVFVVVPFCLQPLSFIYCHHEGFHLFSLLKITLTDRNASIFSKTSCVLMAAIFLITLLGWSLHSSTSCTRHCLLDCGLRWNYSMYDLPLTTQSMDKSLTSWVMNTGMWVCSIPSAWPVGFARALPYSI